MLSKPVSPSETRVSRAISFSAMVRFLPIQTDLNITERQRVDIREALLYCTALVSLKMETPGPFQGTRPDVLDYIREFYRP